MRELAGEAKDAATTPLDEERRRPPRQPGPALVVPRHLKIRTGRWTVEIEPPAEVMAACFNSLTMREIGYRGVTWPTLRRIGISRDLDPYMTEMVMLHELLHACFPVLKPLCSDVVEERIVTNIAPVLLQILKQCRWRKSRAKAKGRRVRRVRGKRRGQRPQASRRVVHPRRGR